MTSSFLRAALAALACLLLPRLAARADETSSSIAFSDPSKPGTLRLRIGHGDIRVRGADVKEITVVTDSKRENRTERKDGLRVLTASSSYTLREANNVASLEYGARSWANGSADFKITVPASTSLVISNALSGDVRCDSIDGDIEVHSMNGEVHLERISGSATVETMNGEVHVSVARLTPGKGLAFSSMNGEVVVRVPEGTKANVRFRTHNGSILTDFDDKALVTVTEVSRRKTSEKDSTGTSSRRWNDDVDESVRDAVREGAEAAREAAQAIKQAVEEGVSEANGAPLPPAPPLPPMTGGKIVSGTLNGGGPDIQVTTMNGDITLRKGDAQK